MNQSPKVAGQEAIAELPEAEDIDSLPLYRRKGLIAVVAIVLLGGVFGMWYYYTKIRGFESTDDAYIDGHRGAISSKILGRILDLMVDEGDTVHQRQILIRLDDADLKSQEAASAAQLEDAKQNVPLAEVTVARARDDFNRAQSQFKNKVIPQEQFEHARSALAAAETQVKISRSKVATADAQLNVIRTNIQNTVIVSPMNGVVAKRYALKGDVVQAGQPVFAIYDLSDVWITANFEETKLTSLHVGDPVEVSVDAYPDVRITGSILQFSASTASQFSLIPPNNASGNFTKVTQRVPVKIAIDRSSFDAKRYQLLPGMSVEVKVKEG
jgi:membrane fusion protein (multidrug efflux system)